MVIMGKSLSFEFVYKFYKDNGCELLTKEYKNEDSYLTYICKCGNKETKKFSAFKRAHYCRECFKLMHSKRKSFSYEDVKKVFLDNGCVLLSKTYKNAWQMLDYMCVCGTKSKIQYANFVKGVRCKGCPSKRKYVEENMRTILNDNGCIYISQTGIDQDDILTFKCKCGEVSTKSIRGFIVKSQCNKCSLKDAVEKKSGENSPMWNPNLTDEEREINRDFPEYKKWRNNVFIRDNYTCQCCGKKGCKLNAHHKDGYHWCEERRLDINNGVSLCENCHKEFHSEYGIKDNTEIQFNEFIKNKTYINYIHI